MKYIFLFKQQVSVLDFTSELIYLLSDIKLYKL